MNTKNLKFVDLRNGCVEEKLQEFEANWALIIPLEYRNLLSQSNGFSIQYPFLYFQISDIERNQISSLYYIEEVNFDFNMLKEDIEVGSNTYFYTDCLLPIAGTLYSGARVFIGFEEPYLNKIYYSDYDVVDENNMPILIKLADLLEDFFVECGYYER